MFSCVFDTDQLAELIAQAPERDGVYLISISTCDPLRMFGLGVATPQKRPAFGRGPDVGHQQTVGYGRRCFLLAGDPADTQSMSFLLGQICRSQHYVGPLGNRNRAKLLVNLVLGLNRAALVKGLVFCKPRRFRSG